MFKIMNGLVRIDMKNLFTPIKMSHNTRGHSQRIFKKHAVKLARSNTFSQRVVNDWNSLPDDVIGAPSIITFKNRLDKFWQNIHYDIID